MEDPVLKKIIFGQKKFLLLFLYLLLVFILLLLKVPGVHAAPSDAYCGRTDFYNDFTYRFNTNDATITMYQGDKPFNCPDSDKAGNKFEFIGRDITENTLAGNPNIEWYYFQSIDFPNYYIFVQYNPFGARVGVDALRVYGLFWDLDLTKDPEFEAVDSFIKRGADLRFLYNSANPSEKISLEVFKAAISKTGNEDNIIGAIGSGEGENACPKFPGITKIGGALNWLISGVICNLTTGINKWMTETLGEIMTIEPLKRGQDSPAYVAWKEVLNISYVLFFLVFLVIIFAETLNLDPKTYAIGLMIPRLVIAIVFVFFSFTISGAIVDVGNVLGKQIAKIPTDVTQQLQTKVGSDKIDAVKVGTGVTVPIVSVWAVLTFWEVIGAGMILYLIGLLITIVFAFAVLVIREIIIYAFVIGSPLVVVMFVLPATQKTAQSFIENFVKLVLMYPLIMLLLASSSIISLIFAEKEGLIGLVGSIVLLLTFALIPSTFKMAGGVMGVVGGGLMKMAGNLKGAVSKSDWAKGMRERAGEKNVARRFEWAQKLRGKGFWGKAAAFPITGGTSGFRSLNQQVEKTTDNWMRNIDDELGIDEKKALAKQDFRHLTEAQLAKVEKFNTPIGRRAAAKSLLKANKGDDEIARSYSWYRNLAFDSCPDYGYMNLVEQGRLEGTDGYYGQMGSRGTKMKAEDLTKYDWSRASDIVTRKIANPGEEPSAWQELERIHGRQRADQIREGHVRFLSNIHHEQMRRLLSGGGKEIGAPKTLSTINNLREKGYFNQDTRTEIAGHRPSKPGLGPVPFKTREPQERERDRNIPL